MNCIELISEFMEENSIPKSIYQDAVEKIRTLNRIDSVNCNYSDSKKFIIMILVDTYKLNADNVKKCANKLSKAFSHLGRSEKDLLKHYYDYNDEKSLNNLCLIMGISSECKNQFIDTIEEFKNDYSDKAVRSFKENLFIADEKNDDLKKFDYLHGLYTRLIALLTPDVMSLHDIYIYNQKFINEELELDLVNKLEVFCSSEEKVESYKARKLFSDYYQKILDEVLIRKSNCNELEKFMNKDYSINTPFEKISTESVQLIVFNINQELYDSYNDYDLFKNVILAVINQTYRILKNHKTIAIKIDNIFTESGHNIKWELYGYIGIYAEHFIPTLEKRKFYKREELCYERCDYLGINLDDTEKMRIKSYYDGKLNKIELADLNIGNYCIDDILLDFENVWYGYTFSDCLSVISGSYKQNSEINFIHNNNQIVLIFSKYRHDDRKIPCPDCAGLNISGNSFPEVGLRSWECKNTICPSRSKSNRGKRYSYKSNFMQRGFEDGVDIISGEMIKKWRRDITVINNESEIFDMLFQYFCFSNENVLLINCEKINIGDYPKLNISSIEQGKLQKMKVDSSLFDDYFTNGGYTKRYLSTKHSNKYDCKHEFLDLNNTNMPTVALGNSQEVLQRINDNTFTAAVTSPPYYNARLYSQWSNLYLYLSDMYEIAKQIFRTMKPGGVYLYNIGDICGNENTIVNSNMGNKRILLGSYTVHIFLAAGFELLDNLLWDKGEPQSNRQKNDGKFTPFYQKPMNVYEHMFLFKKPGATAIVNSNVNKMIEDNWKSNNIPFMPVFKINSKGENILGHTAPFPEDIPNFVAKVFTQNADDIILEPFAGSGTSIISAYKNNRKCFGIEILPEYVSLIKERCQNENIDINII